MPSRVIKAGLPNPARAWPGSSTPVAINNPAADTATISGASQPPTNSTMAVASTTRVIQPERVINGGGQAAAGFSSPDWRF